MEDNEKEKLTKDTIKYTLRVLHYQDSNNIDCLQLHDPYYDKLYEEVKKHEQAEYCGSSPLTSIEPILDKLIEIDKYSKELFEQRVPDNILQHYHKAMTELKRSVDIQVDARKEQPKGRGYQTYNEGLFTMHHLSRKEAIRHIKDLEKKTIINGILKIDQSMPYWETSEREALSAAAKIAWIKEFFSISEEDLKTEKL